MEALAEIGLVAKLQPPTGGSIAACIVLPIKWVSIITYSGRIGVCGNLSVNTSRHWGVGGGWC